jgi:hypothetical protein
VAGAGLLSACATEKLHEDARRDYERSVEDYQNCVAANQMSTCEGERRIMEANKRVLSVCQAEAPEQIRPRPLDPSRTSRQQNNVRF